MTFLYLTDFTFQWYSAVLECATRIRFLVYLFINVFSVSDLGDKLRESLLEWRSYSLS